jgi:hypothetical protein
MIERIVDIFLRFHELISLFVSGYTEASNQLSEVRRENAALSDEIKDIMEQISEGGRRFK